MSKFIIVFLISAALSMLLVPLCKLLARRIGAIDMPDERKIHKIPMPRLGGLAISSSFLITVAISCLVPGYAEYIYKFLNSRAGVLLLGVLILWVVGITNAFNLIDGLDGLAAGVACIAAMTIFGVAFLGQNIPVAMLAVILVGSLIGFLRYNFHPASIFLGDSGSLFLGFVLAIISIKGSQKETTVVALATPILALGLPIVDTFLAMVRRLLKSVYLLNENDRDNGHISTIGGLAIRFLKMFLPDRDHIHHKIGIERIERVKNLCLKKGVALKKFQASVANI